MPKPLSPDLLSKPMDLPNGGGPGTDSEGIQLAGTYVRFLFGLFRRHFLVVLFITAGTVGLTAWRSRGEMPRYSAAAVVRLANARGNLAQGFDAQNAPLLQIDPMQAEIELFRSRTVIGRAVDASGFRLHAPGAPELVGLLEEIQISQDAPEDSVILTFSDNSVTARATSQTATAEYGAPVELPGVRFVVPRAPEGRTTGVLYVIPREAAIDILLGNLGVNPRRSTDFVDVVFTADDPVVAQRVVNVVVQAFQAGDAEVAQQEARRRRQFLAEQLAQNDSIFAAAQLALSAFRNQTQVTSAPNRVAAQQSEVARMELRRQEIEEQRRSYYALLSQLEQSAGTQRWDNLRVLMSSPGITSNPVVTTLYGRLVQYQTARDTLVAASSRRVEALEQVDRLIDAAETQLVEALRSHLTALDAQIAMLEQIETRTEAEIMALTVPPQVEAQEVQLQQRVETIRRLADLVREEYQKARIAEAVEAGQVEVVDLATVPGSAIPSNRGRTLMFSLVIGLVLGMGGAFFLESMDTSIRERSELERTAHLPILATIPRISTEPEIGQGLFSYSSHSGKGRYLPSRSLKHAEPINPLGVVAYRILGAFIALPRGEQALRTVAVTSALPREGKSTTAANLAIAGALEGNRVLLIDCDFARPTLHRAFQKGQSPGLIQVMQHQVSLEDALRSTSVEGLTLLPAGASDSIGAGLGSKVKISALLEQLSGRFDRIVLDSPPVLLAADAMILATLVDGVVLVVRAGTTNRTAVQQAAQQLYMARANVIGAVFNDPDGKAAQYDGYGRYGYYSIQS